MQSKKPKRYFSWSKKGQYNLLHVNQFLRKRKSYAAKWFVSRNTSDWFMYLYRIYLISLIYWKIQFWERANLCSDISCFAEFIITAFLTFNRWVLALSRIIDVGCAECKFLKYLKVLPRAREILGVDISEEDLDYGARIIEPLFIDFLRPRRYTKLEIHLMLGSIAQVDPRLIDVDAVTAIEV